MSHIQFFWANFSAKYVITITRREIMDKGKNMYVIAASAPGINGADGTKSCIDKCKLMSQAVQYWHSNHDDNYDELTKSNPKCAG